MPELPEVETVRRIIEPQIAGQKITFVMVRNPQVIAYPAADEFPPLLTGQTISSMSRRGKFLTVHFESGDRLSLHLRMTGQTKLGIEPTDVGLTWQYLKEKQGNRKKAVKEMPLRRLFL